MSLEMIAARIRNAGAAIVIRAKPTNTAFWHELTCSIMTLLMNVFVSVYETENKRVCVTTCAEKRVPIVVVARGGSDCMT